MDELPDYTASISHASANRLQRAECLHPHLRGRVDEADGRYDERGSRWVG